MNIFALLSFIENDVFYIFICRLLQIQSYWIFHGKEKYPGKSFTQNKCCHLSLYLSLMELIRFRTHNHRDLSKLLYLKAELNHSNSFKILYQVNLTRGVTAVPFMHETKSTLHNSPQIKKSIEFKQT